MFYLRKSAWKIWIAAAIVGWPQAFASAQTRMTPELLWKLKRVSAEGVAPSGKTLFYAAKQYDVATEKSTTTHYALDLRTNKLTERRDKRQIFQMDTRAWYALEDLNIYKSTDEGKSWSLFLGQMPEDADNFRVSPNGKYVSYSREVLVKPMLGTDVYPDLPKNKAQIYTDLNYRHWDTWEDGKFSHLFLQPVSGGVAVDIMKDEPYDCPQKPFGAAEDYVWAPNSKGLVYVCKKKFGKDYAQSTNTDLYYYEIKSGNVTNWSAGMRGYDTNPVFSPDGDMIAWTSMATDGNEADKNDLIVMDVAKGGSWKANLTEHWDGTVENFLWSADGKRLFFNAPVRGTMQLFQVTNSPKPMDVRQSITQLTQGNFDIAGLAGLAGNAIIVSRTDMNHAAELYAFDPAKDLRPLTHENDAIYETLRLSKTELRMTPTSDEKQMGVWVIYPPDFDPKKKYPTLLYCQGGPQSPLTQFYSFRWNFQLMAANGYIVVAPNRRGMPGWGVKWNADISGDWGGQVMKDYLAAIDAIAEEPYVDKDRLGCVGASYGGYSVFMLAALHKNRFKSFIAHDGVFDLKSMYGTTEELWFVNHDLGGAYWNKPIPKGYEKFNPSNFVDKWTAPMLIIQGGTDYRVPIEQGLEAFQAAQLRGVKSKLLYLPNENHWVLHPQNALVWQREFFKWLDETLR